MSFYTDLADEYDDVFPPEREISAFLIRRLASGRNRERPVVDLGCGTGTYSFVLADAGFRVVGVDLDAAMIDAAQAKQRERQHNDDRLRFEVGSMADPSAIVPAGIGHAVCVGNSLVHLETIQAIRSMIYNVGRVLMSGGRFIIQIINFDRVLDRGETELPVLVRNGLEFRRSYRVLGENAVVFEARLMRGSSSGEPTTTLESSVRLVPLRADALTAALRDAGFHLTAVYGAFDGRAHSNDSFLTIAVAEMPSGGRRL